MNYYDNGDVKFGTVEQSKATVWNLELVKFESSNPIVKLSFNRRLVLEGSQAKCVMNEDGGENLDQQWKMQLDHVSSHNLE